MCGIIGLISFDGNKGYMARKDFIMQGIYADTLRGSHGTGVFGVRKRSLLNKVKAPIELYKKPVPGYEFLQYRQVDELMRDMDEYKFFVGHNRYATTGKRDFVGHAHPFRHEHITLVHNGSLTWTHQFSSNHNNFDVDSDMIAYELSIGDAVPVLEKLEGAAALVWYNEKEDMLHMYRNKERPLFFAHVKDSDTTLFGSELHLIKWLAWRNGMAIEESFDVGENQLVSFKESCKPESITTITPKERPPYSYLPPTRGSSWLPFTPKEPAIKRYTSKEASEILREKGFIQGTQIKFYMDEIKKNKTTSRHGKLYGTTVNSPWANVVAYGISIDQFKENEILEGTITWAEEEGKDFAIIVTRLESTGQPYSTGDKVIYLPKDTANDDDKLISGPNNKAIPISEYVRRTKDGCGNCSGDIGVQDAVKISWREDGTPICHDCSNTPYLN